MRKLNHNTRLYIAADVLVAVALLGVMIGLVAWVSGL